MTGDFEIVSIADDLKMLRPSSPYWPESANVYLFRDGGGVSFLDVGCGNPRSAGRLSQALQALRWDTRPVHRIILSHAHPDHSGAMKLVLSEFSVDEILLHETDLPFALDPPSLRSSFDIALCEANAEGMEMPRFDLLGFFNSLGCAMCPVEPTRTLVEGDRVDVGRYAFEVYHTPGHAPGHISLYEREHRFLLSGDVLGDPMAWYAPSSGGASGYLESLQKVEALAIDWVFPSHGKEISDARGLIHKTRETLLSRDRAILRTLEERPRSLRELNRLMFPKSDVRFFPGTTIVQSHLDKLKTEGRIEDDPEPGAYRLAKAR